MFIGIESNASGSQRLILFLLLYFPLDAAPQGCGCIPGCTRLYFTERWSRKSFAEDFPKLWWVMNLSRCIESSCVLQVVVRDSTNAEEEQPWLLQFCSTDEITYLTSYAYVIWYGGLISACVENRLKEEGKDVSIMIFISRSGMQEDLGKTCRGKEARSRATSPDVIIHILALHISSLIRNTTHQKYLWQYDQVYPGSQCTKELYCPYRDSAWKQFLWNNAMFSVGSVSEVKIYTWLAGTRDKYVFSETIPDFAKSLWRRFASSHSTGSVQSLLLSSLPILTKWTFEQRSIEASFCS